MLFRKISPNYFIDFDYLYWQPQEEAENVSSYSISLYIITWYVLLLDLLMSHLQFSAQSTRVRHSGKRYNRFWPHINTLYIVIFKPTTENDKQQQNNFDYSHWHIMSWPLTYICLSFPPFWLVHIKYQLIIEGSSVLYMPVHHPFTNIHFYHLPLLRHAEAAN